MADGRARAALAALLFLLAGAACAPGPGGQAPAGAPAPQPAPRTAPDPAALLGVARGEVARILGSPDFDSRDGAARIWRYSAPGCTLLVVFYADAAGAERSEHLDARRPEGGAADTRTCLGAVVNAPRGA